MVPTPVLAVIEGLPIPGAKSARLLFPEQACRYHQLGEDPSLEQGFGPSVFLKVGNVPAKEAIYTQHARYCGVLSLAHKCVAQRVQRSGNSSMMTLEVGSIQVADGSDEAVRNCVATDPGVTPRIET